MQSDDKITGNDKASAHRLTEGKTGASAHRLTEGKPGLALCGSSAKRRGVRLVRYGLNSFGMWIRFRPLD